MKVKTIKKILENVHRNFANSINDENVQNLVDKNAIITGGAIASMLLDEDVNDYDYYFKNKETVIAIANYYVKIFNEHNNCNAIIDETENRIRISNIPYDDVYGFDADDLENIVGNQNEEYIPVFISENAITLSNQIQIVLRFYGEPDKIHNNYDFVHCTNYYIPSERKMVLNPKALESLLTKELRYMGSKYPLCSVIRTRKFVQRGWSINAGQYLKMCYQISNLDLNNIDVLKEQLIGVDTLYFLQVIDALRDKKNKEPNFELNNDYLSEIIDKIF